MNRSGFLLFLLLLLTSYSFAQNEGEPSFFQQGREAYRQGDYTSAEIFFRKNLSHQDSSSEAKADDQIIARLLLGDVYRKQRNLNKAMPFYEKAMEMAEAGGFDNLYLSAAQNRAFLYSKMYEPIRAINEFKRLLPFAEKAFGKKSSQVGNLTMNLGIDYFKMGAYYRAEQQFLAALALYQQTAEPNSEQFNRIYSNMGVNYRKMGAYDKALEFGEKALKIKLLHYPPNHPSVSKYHLNIGRVYRDMKQPEKALAYLEKALAIEQQHFPDNHPYVTGMKGEVANVLADLKRYEEALRYYRASQSVDTQYMAADHPYIIASYANIALVHLEMEQYDKALAMHQQAVGLMVGSGYFPPYKKAEMQQLLSKIYEKKGAYIKALRASMKGLAMLSNTGEEDFGNELPAVSSFDDHRLYIEIMTCIGQLHEKMGAISLASEAAEKAVEAVHLLRRSYHDDEDRQFLNNELSGLFELAVRTAFAAYRESEDEQYLKQAFTYMEAAKADVIKHAVNEGLALRSAGIPDALLDSLDDLAFKIGGLQDDLNDWLMDADPDLVPDSLKSDLFGQKEKHRALLRHIEQNYPQYHQLKFGKAVGRFSEIGKGLQKQDAALLSYFYDDSSLYVILIQDGKVYGFQKNHAAKLASQITGLRAFLNPENAFKLSPQGLLDFQIQSSKLYQLLLEDALSTAQTKQDQHLIIIPYGVLHYLPFEVLHPEQEGGLPFKQTPFLIKTYQVTYALSASLWAQERQSSGEKTKDYKGFAPQYDSLSSGMGERGDFGALHWNVQEVKNAQRLLRGNIFIGSAATEEQFRRYAPEAEVLHLSMHADVNDQLPMRSGLLFTPGADSVENGFLNLYEIYNLKLPAQTVILNACNTGYGALAKGEGVLSLSHAFSYAGCRNILLNLWLADDQASSQIVNGFYKQRQAGLSQAAALRQAKLAYLEAADPLRAHPYFWAGLVLQGGIAEEKSGFSWWWGLGVLLLVAGGYFFLTRSPSA